MGSRPIQSIPFGLKVPSFKQKDNRSRLASPGYGGFSRHLRFKDSSKGHLIPVGFARLRRLPSKSLVISVRSCGHGTALPKPRDFGLRPVRARLDFIRLNYFLRYILRKLDILDNLTARYLTPATNPKGRRFGAVALCNMWRV